MRAHTILLVLVILTVGMTVAYAGGRISVGGSAGGSGATKKVIVVIAENPPSSPPPKYATELSSTYEYKPVPLRFNVANITSMFKTATNIGQAVKELKQDGGVLIIGLGAVGIHRGIIKGTISGYSALCSSSEELTRQRTRLSQQIIMTFAGMSIMGMLSAIKSYLSHGGDSFPSMDQTVCQSPVAMDIKSTKGEYRIILVDTKDGTPQIPEKIWKSLCPKSKSTPKYLQPPPQITYGKEEEENAAIPVPKGLKKVEINGKKYNVQQGIAIVPKKLVPAYFTIVGGKIEETDPDKANATIIDLQYATVVMVKEYHDKELNVTFSGIGVPVRLDVFVPKDVVKSTDNIMGPYLTLIPDPILRIYLQAKDGNADIKKISIHGANKDEFPGGTISFGSCDAGVSDLQINKTGKNRYQIMFSITDAGNPIVAKTVFLKVDSRQIIPQFDSRTYTYSAEVSLPPGTHKVTISAETGGCGEIIYQKTFETGNSSILGVIIAAIAAILVAYALMQMILR